MRDQITFAGALVAVAVGLISVWLWVRPGMQRSAAVADAILGEQEVTDRAGKVIAPARPGLVSRTATLEQAVATLVNQDARLAALELTVAGHETRLLATERHALERIVTKAESAEMWRAVANTTDPNQEENPT